MEIRDSDPNTIRLNRPVEVRITIESKASGFKKADVNAMVHLGRLGVMKEGESLLGYFSLKPNIIDERVVFYMFVVPEALERMGVILDCGRNEEDLAEAGAYQVCPRDFLSKEQVAAIKKLKDAR